MNSAWVFFHYYFLIRKEKKKKGRGGGKVPRIERKRKKKKKGEKSTGYEHSADTENYYAQKQERDVYSHTTTHWLIS